VLVTSTSCPVVDNLCGYPETVGDHANGAAGMLTCVPAKKVIDGVELGISVDQVAAATLGKLTPRPSLELGMAKSGGVGDCDSGYGLRLRSSLSWSEQDHAPARSAPIPKTPGCGCSAPRRLAHGRATRAHAARRQERARLSL